MILQGGMLEMAYHIGKYDAAVNNGYSPDLLVATCGGGLSAALIAAIPSQQERLAFLLSEPLYEAVRDIRLNMGAWHIVKGFYVNAIRTQHQKPDLTGPPLLQGTEKFWSLPVFKKAFRASSGPAVVVLGSRINISAEDFKDPTTRVLWDRLWADGALYKQVYFTDAQTAATLNLENFRPMLSRRLPYAQAPFVPKAEVRTQETLGTAARVSATDPYFLTPLTLPSESGAIEFPYLGGASDVLPLETTLEWADHVMADFQEDFDPVLAQPLNHELYNVQQNEFLNSKYANPLLGRRTVWVDRSDMGASYMFGWGLSPVFALALFGDANNLPNSLTAYQDRVRAMYLYGYVRAQQALAFGKTHVQLTEMRQPKAGLDLSKASEMTEPVVRGPSPLDDLARQMPALRIQDLPFAGPGSYVLKLISPMGKSRVWEGVITPEIFVALASGAIQQEVVVPFQPDFGIELHRRDHSGTQAARLVYANTLAELLARSEGRAHREHARGQLVQDVVSRRLALEEALKGLLVPNLEDVEADAEALREHHKVAVFWKLAHDRLPEVIPMPSLAERITENPYALGGHAAGGTAMAWATHRYTRWIPNAWVRNLLIRPGLHLTNLWFFGRGTVRALLDVTPEERVYGIRDAVREFTQGELGRSLIQNGVDAALIRELTLKMDQEWTPAAVAQWLESIEASHREALGAAARSYFNTK